MTGTQTPTNQEAPMSTTLTQTPTTAATVTELLTLATTFTEETVLNSACVVWTYRLRNHTVDLVVSRTGGRIVRAHVLETGPGGVWHHFTGTPSSNAKQVLALVR